MRISDWSSDVCSSDLEDSAVFAIDVGLAPGVFVTPTDDLKVVGSVLQAKFVDRRHPVANGYDSDDLAVYSAEGLSFQVSNIASPGNKARQRGSEERRVGKAGVRTCRSRWSPNH